jgi:hypothetical protein
MFIMKRVILILVLMMSVIAVNAQASKSSGTKTKSTHTVVQVADLQKPITDNIAKDYAGYTIKSASSVTSGTGTTYHVVVAKGSATETLVYDKDGAFVKKLPKSTSAHHSSKKK